MSDSIMSVDKYTYRVEWSAEDQVHVARCLEFPSLGAHGKSAIVALKEIERVVTASIKWMAENGEAIPEPFGMKAYKGNLTLRIPAELHRSIAVASAEQGVSINQYILAKIAR
ncbi:MAG: type II toxin-antitoxin system HicB family antitoxin [Coriobacteriales bacterium]|jgi:predicted HicB family RNase H-like nuclease|nr:type II toxin-antitoxin system HicB family antitoxin [Coriobacteriales bacterium]